MVIRLNENYEATLNNALLGYIGETNARPVSVEGLTVDGADRYVLTIDYGDGVTYEVDITGGTWTPTADILRSAQTVSCQICAKKLSGDEYELVKKSRIFRLRIGAAIGDVAVPSPDVAMDALDRIDAIGRQAHADMQTAVTAAETATTAVEKIAENTAEIANVKLTDKELKRRVDALFDIGQGVTHKFETDSETAYTKTVPTGAKLMSVKNVGGRSVVFNQFAKNKPFDSRNGITTSTDGNYSVLDGTATNAITAKGWWCLKLDEFSPTNGHKYLFCSKIISGTVNPANGCTIGTAIQKQIVGKSFIFEMSDKHWDSNWLSAIYSDKDTVFNKLKFSVMLIDLALMFGSGNEPASVEEFEAMFPNDYYPYNVGEIISAGTESVVEQGKNLFDYTDKTHYGANISKVENGVIYTKGLTTTVLNVPTVAGNKYTLSFKIKSNTTNQGGLRWSLQKGKNISYAHDSSLIKSEVGFAANTEYQAVVPFVADTDFVSLCTIVGMVYDVQLENGNTITNYSPFYQTEHPIPEAIRNLPGYGVEGNIVDYENKTYTQVNSVSGTEIVPLEKPIVTDISTMIPDDFLRNIEVEAGGSVTFKNSNDNYHIPVPSEEEYIVKLSEVGGTT